MCLDPMAPDSEQPQGDEARTGRDGPPRFCSPLHKRSDTVGEVEDKARARNLAARGAGGFEP